MKPAHVWLVALMFGFSVASYFERTILSVAAPLMMKEFDLSPTSMGMVFSSFQLSYTLLMTPGGRWSDKFGPRNTLGVGCFGAALFTSLLPIARSIPLLAAMRFIFGIFTAPLYPSCGHMTSLNLPSSQHTRVFGIVNAGAGVGGAISPLLFTFLIANLGWRYSFVAAGGAGMLLSILWLLTVPDRRGASPGSAAPATNWGLLLKNPNLRWLILGYAAIDYFQYIFVYWLYYYLGEVRKLPQADIAFYATMPFVAWFIMMPTGGWIADYLSARKGLKVGLRTVTIISLVMASICLIAALSAEDTNVLVALLSLALGFAAAADVPFWSAAVSLGGRQAGAAGGLMNTGGNLGGALAPILTPYLATHYGWSAGLYAGAAIAVVGVIAWLRIDPAPPAEAQAQTAAGA